MPGLAIVTGGAGFIGSHLSEELANRGYRVTIIDNLSTGKLDNIRPLLRRGDVSFEEGSITDITFLEKHFRGASHIFHQAAIPSVPRSIKDPQTSHEVNTTGTLNVLLAARDNQVKKVVCASSSSVYGDTPVLPKREDMPLNPLSPYAVSKLTGEYYCRVFNLVYALPTICLRYFNVYGPRQDPDSQYAAVIPRFIQKVMNSNPPVIFGDGEQTRDFTFVKDVVEANILAAESEATGNFNIGRGEAVSINQLVMLIATITGKDIKPVYEAPRTGDVKHSLADISQASKFGYKPKHNLESGLRHTVNALMDV